MPVNRYVRQGLAVGYAASFCLPGWAQPGWAVAVEQSFETQLQGGWIHCCSRLGAVNQPIYLRNAESRIFRLWSGEFPPGQWSFIAP